VEYLRNLKKEGLRFVLSSCDFRPSGVTGAGIPARHSDFKPQSCPDIVMRWKGRLVREFYVEAGCGGVLLENNKEAGEHTAIVPIVHQSVLAGALLAAEIIKVTHGLTTPDKLASFKMSVFKAPYIYNMKKTPKDPRCFCQDEDYLSSYRQKYKQF